MASVLAISFFTRSMTSSQRSSPWKRAARGRETLTEIRASHSSNANTQKHYVQLLLRSRYEVKLHPSLKRWYLTQQEPGGFSNVLLGEIVVLQQSEGFLMTLRFTRSDRKKTLISNHLLPYRLCHLKQRLRPLLITVVKVSKDMRS